MKRGTWPRHEQRKRKIKWKPNKKKKKENNGRKGQSKVVDYSEKMFGWGCNFWVKKWIHNIHCHNKTKYVYWQQPLVKTIIFRHIVQPIWILRNFLQPSSIQFNSFSFCFYIFILLNLFGYAEYLTNPIGIQFQW